MEDNQFKDFPPQTFNSSLMNLNLNNNKLTTLRKEWFVSSPNYLYLEGNPLHCDCSLYNVIQALTAENKYIEIYGECHSPVHLNGARLYEDIEKANKLNCTACSSNECKNNATCQVINATSYNCSCSEKFHGKFCQFENKCFQSPCGNNGTCLKTNSSFICNCMEGFVGTKCYLTHPCYSDNPCENSGQCDFLMETTSHTCTCMFGYLGSRCQINVGFIVLVCLIVFATFTMICILCFYKPKHSDIYIVEKGHLLSTKIGIDNPSFAYTAGQSSTSQN